MPKPHKTILSVAAVYAVLFLLPAKGRAADPSANPQPEPDASVSAASENAQLRREMEQLKQLVQQQQARITALEYRDSNTGVDGALGLTPTDLRSPMYDAAPEAVPVALGFGSPLPYPQAQAQAQQNAGSSDERVRNLERRLKGLGPLSFSGDIRLREEPTFGGPSDGSIDRNRARVRARLNILADLGPQFQAGLSLATGDVNDPTTTNGTLGVFYTRKAFALDQAYVSYAPSWFKPLTAIAGKFRYPWYNTELTWDKDLNPEGAAQTLAFNLENASVLKRIAVVGFELPFAEEAGTGLTNKNIVQSMAYGTQLQTNWKFGSRLQLSAYAGYYDFQNADTISQALAKASARNPQTPWAGSLPLSSRQYDAELHYHHGFGEHRHYQRQGVPDRGDEHRECAIWFEVRVVGYDCAAGLEHRKRKVSGHRHWRLRPEHPRLRQPGKHSAPAVQHC